VDAKKDEVAGLKNSVKAHNRRIKAVEQLLGIASPS
jgi:hypothetical protein